MINENIVLVLLRLGCVERLESLLCSHSMKIIQALNTPHRQPDQYNIFIYHRLSLVQLLLSPFEKVLTPKIRTCFVFIVILN